MPQPPFIRALLSWTMCPMPSSPMPSPPLPSASLPWISAPWPAAGVVELDQGPGRLVDDDPALVAAHVVGAHHRVPGELQGHAGPARVADDVLHDERAGGVDDAHTAAVCALDGVALDPGVVGRQQLLSDHDAGAETVRELVVDDHVVDAAPHCHARAGGSGDLVVLDPVAARLLDQHALSHVGSQGVVAHDGVAGATVEP